MLSTGKQLTKEEAEQYNLELSKLRDKWFGCVSCKPCMGCYIMVCDSICLCVGNFKCPKCGFENGIPIRELAGRVG